VYSWFARASHGLSETSSDSPRFVTSSYVVAAQRNNIEVPISIALYQDYPNPFNPSTTIEFALVKSSFLTLRVYELLGRQVGELVNEKLEPGMYKTQSHARGVAGGVYLYRLMGATT
jgi:hypothetical protein